MTQRRLRVLIALPSLGMGGEEQFLTSLANELSDRVEFHFCIFSTNLSLKDRLIDARVHSFSGPIAGLLSLPRFVGRLSPDLVLSSIVDLNIAIVALRYLLPRRTRVVLREASDPESALTLSRFPVLTRFMYRLFYPKADRIVCLSDNMLSEVQRILSVESSKLSTISNGVGRHRMVSLPIKQPKERIILAVGRLSQEKGFDELIRAFSRFVKLDAGNSYQLVILGDGPLMHDLRRTISDLELNSKVHLEGMVQEPKPYYSQASFLALPSRFEGVSNVMLEALVNGVPVVATTERTSADLYINETNGVLVKSCNELELTVGLERMNALLEGYDRGAIARTWRSLVGLDVVAESYFGVFSEVVKDVN